ncbi:FAD/NAD(P)-binding protein [Vibrio sp. PP-XX7]
MIIYYLQRKLLLVSGVQKYIETGNERYNKNPDEFPTRELYGESLSEIFQALVEELIGEGINVSLVTDEVTSIEKNQTINIW